MKKCLRFDWIVVRVFLGVVLFLTAGAAVRALLERNQWARILTYEVPPSPVPSAAPFEIVPQNTEVALPTLSFLLSNRVEQSDVFIVSLENTPEGVTPILEWYDRSYNFLTKGNRMVAFLGADAKQVSGTYPFTVAFGTSTLARQITVTKRAFPVTVLVVTPELEAHGYAPLSIQTNIAAENIRLNSALIYTSTARFSKPFVNPLDRMAVVGAYGNIRKNGDVELQHLGVDLDAAEGTPVYAINDGVVNLAEMFVNYGNTIVVDHGLGIFSFYLHLSALDVKAGDGVARGQMIAKSGNTGYSIAPHLHFSVRIRNASVDPMRFIEAVNGVLGAALLPRN
ncbi:MAG: M23 family metallopeptidase [Candidatus Brennerbacteria bacterium]|nr:M23 family metallopeptidase [Candidatus Brennerbacteria bacterium]